MGKVNMSRKNEPEDFTRSDLQQWRDTIRAEVISHIQASYIESSFFWIAALDPKWNDNALSDSIADATHDAWLKLED